MPYALSEHVGTLAAIFKQTQTIKHDNSRRTHTGTHTQCTSCLCFFWQALCQAACFDSEQPSLWKEQSSDFGITKKPWRDQACGGNWKPKDWHWDWQARGSILWHCAMRRSGYRSIFSKQIPFFFAVPKESFPCGLLLNRHIMQSRLNPKITRNNTKIVMAFFVLYSILNLQVHFFFYKPEEI